MPKSTAESRASQGSEQGADRARRRSGLRAIAATVPKVTRRALGRRALGAAGLIADWPQVVGPEISARCHPRKLERPRRGDSKGGVLTLRADAGFALELQHLEPLLIERINGYLGFAAVSRLRLIQTPGRRPPPAPPRTAPIDPAREAALLQRVESVTEPDLHDALLALGRAVAGEQNKAER